MNGEEKKSKKRSKTVEVGLYSDDDEPIGSLFKLKRPRNPKKVVKVGLGGSGEKGQKSEVKEEKLVVENEDLGGMDDTLASFRKKLKGPKKDVGSGTLRGRSSAFNGQVEDDGLLDAKLESKIVETGGDMGDDGSDVNLDKVENKGKGKVRRPNIDSLTKTIGGHAAFVNDSESLEVQKEHGKGISHSGNEKLDDPLSAFFQRTQSGLTRKSRPTNSALKQNTRAQTLEDGISPSTEGVSGVLTSGSVRRSQSASTANLVSKNQRFEDEDPALIPSSSTSYSEGVQEEPGVEPCGSNVEEEATVGPCSPNEVHDGDGQWSTCSHPKYSCSAPSQKGKSDTRAFTDGLKLCSMVKASTLVHDVVVMPDSISAGKQMEKILKFGEGELKRGFSDALDQQSEGISTIHISSEDPENLSSLIGKEDRVPCSDDELLYKMCDTSKVIHQSVSDRKLEASVNSLSQIEEDVQTGNRINIDTCLKGSHQIQPHLSYSAFDSTKMEETCSGCDVPNTYTEEPDLLSVSLQKENAVVSDGRLSPTIEMSCGVHKSEISFQMNLKEKSLETCVHPNEFVDTTLHQNQPSNDAPKWKFVPSHGYLSINEEANGVSPPSTAPDENESYPEDEVSVPDSDNKDSTLSAIQRGVRKPKKRRLGDMAYEGDADWETLINEQSFLESHEVLDSDRSFRTREKLDSSLNISEVDNGGAAAVSAGLKALAAGPFEKIKFKEVLKRKGGLQEYLECRNHILGLWSKDVSRILPITDCGVIDTPSEDEPPRASLIREIYAFLDQSGYINVGIASEKDKVDVNAKHNYELFKEKNFEGSSMASVADSDDGVSFILGRVKSSETSMEAKNGIMHNDGNQTSEATKGRGLVTSVAIKIPNVTDPEDCPSDDCKKNGSIDAKLSDRLVNLDLGADSSCEKLDGGTVPAITPEVRNDSHIVQSASYDQVGGNNEMQCDSEVRKRIIVVGAGPAGLTAARHLQRQGFSVTVLEARSRIGGRVYTDRSSLSVPVDLGASIITGVEADVATERRPDPSSLVCAQLGLELTVLNSDCPLYDIVTGQKVPADLDEALEAEYNSLLDDTLLVVAQKGEQAMRMSLEDGLEYALKTRRIALLGTDIEDIELRNSMGASFDPKTSSVDGIVPEKNCSKGEILSPLERRVMDWHFAHLEYGCAALLKEVSLPNWNQDDVYGGFGGAHCMIKGGYSTVVESLGEGLLIHLNHVVTDISYGSKDSGLNNIQGDKVKVSTSIGSEFIGDAVLITVPLGCLKAGTINFFPPLPPWKHSSIQQLGFGVLNKVVLEFPEVFWDDSVDYFGATAEETDRRGQCFMFWNVKKTVGAPVLIALVVGKAAIDGQNLSSSDHVNHAVTVLRKLFGEASVPDPVASVVTDWGRDPFSYGAYSYVAVGASGEDYDILGRPVENCLFFAGEATCKEHPDTVGGAMMSGLREAVRIIDILNTGNDYTAEVEAMEAAQRQSDSESDEVRDITMRLDAIELSNVLYRNSLDRARILTREALLQDMFFNAKTTAGRLHLAKELLKLPVETLKSFAGTKKGLTMLNSWMLDSMGKDGTQLLRHCVRLLVRVSTDLLAVRLSGIGKTVKEKVCVHTSRDIRAIASQLVNVWLEVFRKQKASNNGPKFSRQATAVDPSKRKSLKDTASGKPPLRSHDGGLENKGQHPPSAGNHLPSNGNSKSEINPSSSRGLRGRMDTEVEDTNLAMSEEEQAAFAAAEAARAAYRAVTEASEAKCNTLLQLPKIPSFHKFARREHYAQMDECDVRRKWSSGILGRQDCVSEIDSRNCRVRDWSVDFSAACVNLDSSRKSVDNLSQRSHSNEMACHMNFREHSGESAAVDSSIFTKAWVDTAGSVGIKDYHAIERWQSQAAAADSDFYHQSMHIKDEEDSNTSSRPPAWKHDRLANESSISQVTINKEPQKNHPRDAERIKQAVVDYVASLLMPLYKARKIDREGYKSIMKKSATKVMEQATDAEKAMAVSEFLDFKRRNKIRAFVDKLIERHMTLKPAAKL